MKACERLHVHVHTAMYAAHISVYKDPNALFKCNAMLYPMRLQVHA